MIVKCIMNIRNKDDNIHKQRSTKLWMGICTSRKKEYSLKSRIDLLEKINTKPYFIQYNDIPTFKLNYILDAQNNSTNFYDTVISKKFANRTKNTKDIRNYVEI